MDDQSTGLPAWRRPGTESLVPVLCTLAAAAVLQDLLPRSLERWPHRLVLGLEVLLAVVMVVAHRRRPGADAASWFEVSGYSSAARYVTGLLIVVMVVANTASVVLLISRILGTAPTPAVFVLKWGGAIWFTNLVVFSFVYWQFDCGGPGKRADGIGDDPPDLVFPQMSESPDLSPDDWRPKFLDYLFTSFTAAAAFSPTDVMPYTRRLKMTMMLQSMISVGLGLLVIAYAVNNLK